MSRKKGVIASEWREKRWIACRPILAPPSSVPPQPVLTQTDAPISVVTKGRSEKRAGYQQAWKLWYFETPPTEWSTSVERKATCVAKNGPKHNYKEDFERSFSENGPKDSKGPKGNLNILGLLRSIHCNVTSFFTPQWPPRITSIWLSKGEWCHAPFFFFKNYKCSFVFVAKRFILWAPLSRVHSLSWINIDWLVIANVTLLLASFSLYSRNMLHHKLLDCHHHICVDIIIVMNILFFSSMNQCVLNSTSGYLKNHSDGKGWQCSIWSNHPISSSSTLINSIWSIFLNMAPWLIDPWPTLKVC